jgi:hypothetical protein
MKMRGITTAKEIADLEPKKVIVSVFLLTGYDHAAHEWLHNAWEQIHRDSGQYWFLLVPRREPHLVNVPMQVDLGLSEEIREMYGVSEKQTPCLVFDNFIEEQHQHVLSLRGDEILLKRMMGRMAQRMRAEIEMLGDKPRTDTWRREVTDKVFEAGQWAHVEKGFLGIAKQAISLLPKGIWRLASVP